MWSVWEVVFSCQGQDQMLSRAISVTCRERNQTSKYPEERNPLYNVCLDWIADNAWSPHVRQEDPD